jgi:hypothetical protein
MKVQDYYAKSSAHNLLWEDVLLSYVNVDNCPIDGDEFVLDLINTYDWYNFYLPKSSIRFEGVTSGEGNFKRDDIFTTHFVDNDAMKVLSSNPVMAATHNHPSEYFWVDTDVAHNYESPLYATQDARAELRRISNHEVGHVLGAGHCNFPDSLFFRSYSVNDYRGMFMSINDLAYLTWMWNGEAAGEVVTNPYAVLAEGTRFHHQVYIPCLYMNGKYHYAVLEKQEVKNGFRMFAIKVLETYEEMYFVNHEDYSFTNKAVFEQGKLTLFDVYTDNGFFEFAEFLRTQDGRLALTDLTKGARQ